MAAGTSPDRYAREDSWQHDGQSSLGEESSRAALKSSTVVEPLRALDEPIEDLLVRVYEAAGATKAAATAKAMAATLARDLHVTTVAHLMQALEVEEELEDLRSLVRGRLFTALVAELRRVQAADRARQPRRKYPRRELELSVLRVDLINISAIDEINQTFAARLYVQCAFRGGARDEFLSSESRGFPVDEHGTPTFRPSAAWFLDQVEFHNAKCEVTVLDYKVVAMGDDLMLNLRLEGEFFEVLELEHFPFDRQDLPFIMAVKCAREGPCPLSFTIDPAVVRDVEGTQFALRNTWALGSELRLEATTVYSTKTRVFPAVKITASIHRRPFYFLLNVALPASVLSLLSLITFCIPQEAVSDRLGFSSTLALTIISAKFATSSSMPAIAYLTLLDRFQLACIGIIFLIVAEASVYAILHEVAAARAERVLLGASVLLWLGVQALFGHALWWHTFKQIDADGNGRISEDELISWWTRKWWRKAAPEPAPEQPAPEQPARPPLQAERAAAAAPAAPARAAPSRRRSAAALAVALMAAAMAAAFAAAPAPLRGAPVAPDAAVPRSTVQWRRPSAPRPRRRRVRLGG